MYKNNHLVENKLYFSVGTSQVLMIKINGIKTVMRLEFEIFIYEIYQNRAHYTLFTYKII